MCKSRTCFEDLSINIYIYLPRSRIPHVFQCVQNLEKKKITLFQSSASIPNPNRIHLDILRSTEPFHDPRHGWLREVGPRWAIRSAHGAVCSHTADNGFLRVCSLGVSFSVLVLKMSKSLVGLKWPSSRLLDECLWMRLSLKEVIIDALRAKPRPKRCFSVARRVKATRFGPPYA